MKMIRFLMLLLLFAVPTKAFAATTSTPVGCPYISSPSCGIPVFPTGSPYAINQWVQGSDGNIYQSQVSTNVANPTSATECGDNWKPVQIYYPVTVNVATRCGGATAAALQKALNFMSSTYVAMSTRVTYNIATTSFGTTNFNLNNPFGRNFDIIGDQVTPSNVQLTFSGVPGTVDKFNHALFELDHGYAFGQIDGFVFTGPGCAGGPPCTTNNYLNSGLLVMQGSGSVATLGPHVTANNGYFAINVRDNASAIADGTICTGGGDGCFWAYSFGVLQAIGTQASGAVNVNSGSGYLADNGGYVMMDGSFSYSNIRGASSFSGGRFRLTGTLAGNATFGHNSSGTLLGNTIADIYTRNSEVYFFEGNANYFSANRYASDFTNFIDGLELSDGGGLTQYAVISARPATLIAYCNANNTNCWYGGVNKNTQKAFNGSANSAPNTSPMGFAVASFSAPWCFGGGNLLSACGDADGAFHVYYGNTVKQDGPSSGTISFKTQAAAGTYNWNWPITAGTAGYLLTSDGGGAGGGMTWTANTFAPLASPTFTGTLTAPTIINSGITADTGHTDTAVCQDTTTHQFYSGTGTLGICLGTSSKRYKNDLGELTDGLEAIMDLRPRRHTMKDGHGVPGKVMYGFYAEDAYKVLPTLTGMDAEGKPNTFDYLGLVPVLVKAVQQQERQINAVAAHQDKNAADPLTPLHEQIDRQQSEIYILFVWSFLMTGALGFAAWRRR